MDYWQRERIGALTGVGAVVLFGIAQAMTDAYPAPGDSAAVVQRFIVENRDGLLAQTFVMGIGVALTLWFLGSLRSTLRRAEGSAGRVAGIAYSAGVVTSAFVLLNLTVLAALANGIAADGTPDITLTFFRLATVLMAFTSIPLLVLLGATGLVSLRTGLLPRWLTALTIVPIAGNVIGATSIFTRTGEYAPGGSMAFYAPFVTTLVWLAGTSIVLAMRTGTPVEPKVARRRIGDIPGRADQPAIDRRRRAAESEDR